MYCICGNCKTGDSTECPAVQRHKDNGKIKCDGPCGRMVPGYKRVDGFKYCPDCFKENEEQIGRAHV